MAVRLGGAGSTNLCSRRVSRGHARQALSKRNILPEASNRENEAQMYSQSRGEQPKIALQLPSLGWNGRSFQATEPEVVIQKLFSDISLSLSSICASIRELTGSNGLSAYFAATKAVNQMQASSEKEPADGNSQTETATKSGDAQAPVDSPQGQPDASDQITATVHSSIRTIEKEAWDKCTTSETEQNPFVCWDFLAALEDSDSAVRTKGWLPQHVAIRSSTGELLAACPMYLKVHSYGEYVFDNAWANFYAQMGQEYYPKLQCCVPFTPVTGPRLLIAPGGSKSELRRALMETLTQIADQMKVSSLHMTFNTEEEWREMGQAGWLKRTGLQYHWNNDGYKCFEDFLSALKQSKRKNIRQERKSIAKQGLVIERLRGDAIGEAEWDAFYTFYRDTVDRKWGTAYLTRDFFMKMSKTMGDKVLLVIARDSNRDNELVAAALNFIGSDALYGRNWGCKYGDSYKNLHFELCYYQAIDAAIEMGLGRVEAGAQGQHKIQRGYLPNMTYSSHYVRDPYARGAIQNFLHQEVHEMEHTIAALTEFASPFKIPPVEDAFAAMGEMSRDESSSGESDVSVSTD